MLIENNNKLLNGVVDLVCIGKDQVVVVDYKTDLIQNHQAHRKQLECYRKAIGDIYKLPVETYLFYLRSAQAVKL